MKNVILIVVGCTPFLFGGLLNWSMLTLFFNTSLPYFLIGLLALLIWFVVAFCCGKLAKSAIQATILLNLMGLIVLILVGVQELILQAYWMNFVGLWTQLFYLPLLNIGFTLISWDRTLFSAYCVAFLFMIIVSFLAFQLYLKRPNKT